ncbi:uncharacterized protein RHOBADRAFT_54400 [Rhodotorula graminis WP1]|uniref:DM2 domain-containing protein n=1 Tax=Rhodotorula graminis (strain WP1) TaxID=578459 RepID=A0A0P9FDH5_RHOGW|nr:uncharacterized protein RHOBADRAFT_54400 [Rhodotorula graminis WP1]KPV73803.1 hypothetical protein RHOBADRAFT_54400 [Rhodotorula graminis WP1]
MSYPATAQQQQALFAHMNPLAHQQQQAHAQAQYAQLQAQARGNPQLQQQLHAQQLRAMQQQQGAPAPAPVVPASQPAGISSRERDVGDGDDHYRNAKRRKPTDRSLPSSFKPSLPSSVPPGPSDLALAPSLDALDRLGDAYKRLQDIERKVDWTVARKAVEVQEKATGTVGRGEPFRRTLRIHVTATARDQPWQLSTDDLAKEGDKEAVPDPATEAENKPDTASDDTKVKVPRVEVRVTGEILEDDRYPSSSTPFTTFLHRLVVETPSRDPAVQPVGAQPLSWTRPSPHAQQPSSPPKLPAALESSHPLSGGPDTKLDLKLSLYVAHPAGDRYALHPELASVLDTAEADRVGVLEALWSYAKSRGLVEENSDASAAGAATAPQQQPGAQVKSGIKPDDRLRKFFGNVGLVQFHHLPEYLNRLLLPPPPRQFVLSVPVSADAAAAQPQHFAFDTPIYVPSPVQPALDSALRALSSLVNPAATSPPTGSTTSPAAVLAAELSALDDKLALNALATRQHAQQLHALQGFARDPRGFLERWVDSQRARSPTCSPRRGSDGVLGPRWRDEIRKADSWDAPWVKEAVEVWALRDVEGKAQRARQAQVLQQQQAYAQQQQQAQYHANAAVGYGRR